MSKIPVLKASEVIRLLEKRGFVQVRQRGSHKQFRHDDGRSTTVPFHKGRDISHFTFHISHFTGSISFMQVSNYTYP
ncbi:type II toxin-antitoxin system HicA family toxin [Microcystis aeruginosa]|nr:type II toxin-antitoxin system HicA family toxin [Microcystis aeruginosa]